MFSPELDELLRHILTPLPILRNYCILAGDSRLTLVLGLYFPAAFALVRTSTTVTVTADRGDGHSRLIGFGGNYLWAYFSLCMYAYDEHDNLESVEGKNSRLDG